MRLIDADAFIQMMEEKCDPESTLDPWVLSVCRGGVKIMPTVDAISVVRCRDCKKAEHDTIFREYWCGGREVDPDGYCSNGEQNDGEQHGTK